MRGNPVRRRMVLVFAGAMLASAGARSISPTRHIADEKGALDLNRAVPTRFGEWSMDTNQPAMIVNPQQQSIIDEIYAQVLSRTYVHADGYRIMVAIAYGKDQREALQVHFPEICYTMQGFTVLSEKQTDIEVAGGSITVVQLDTALGAVRPEPLTYWLVVGDKAVGAGATSKKLVEMSYTLRGWIPDGLLFRVSSIDPDAKAAHERQTHFVQDLAAAMPSGPRHRILGI